MIAYLMDFYSISHNVRQGRLFSKETLEGVKALRKIYMLNDGNNIDSELYKRMIEDISSIKGNR